MTLNAWTRQLLKKHGVVGPVLCAAVIVGSIYGGALALSQIRTEWGYLKKNSRQDWKQRIVPKLE